MSVNDMVAACSVSAELAASASRVGVALLFDSAGRAYQEGAEHTETMAAWKDTRLHSAVGCPGVGKRDREPETGGTGQPMQGPEGKRCLA